MISCPLNDEFSYFNDIKILRMKHVENVSLDLCTFCAAIEFVCPKMSLMQYLKI